MKEATTYREGYSTDTNDYDCEWQYTAKLLYLHMDGIEVSPAKNNNHIYNQTTNSNQCEFWQLQQMEQLSTGKLNMVQLWQSQLMGPIDYHEHQNNKYQKPFAMQNAYLVTKTYDISGIRKWNNFKRHKIPKSGFNKISTLFWW